MCDVCDFNWDGYVCVAVCAKNIVKDLTNDNGASLNVCIAWRETWQLL